MLFRSPTVRNTESSNGTGIDPLQSGELDRVEILIGPDRCRVLTAMFEIDH